MDLQLQMVRPSIKFYLNFSLLMGSSPGFGFSACDLGALFRLGFPTASDELFLNLATYS